MAKTRTDKPGELRSSLRRDLRLIVASEGAADEDMPIAVLNISTTGMLVETSLALGEGDRLAIDLPERGMCRAEIVWRSEGLYGCRFVEPVPQSIVSAALLKGGPTSELELLGRRIAAARRERGLSQLDLARRVDVSRTSIWKWEKGQAMPRRPSLSRIAEVLGIRISQLLGEFATDSLFSDDDESDSDNSLAAQVANCRQRIAYAAGIDPGAVRIILEY